jgi:hypothetical protein
VLEAKKGRPRALAKHKLFYPLMGLRTSAPAELEEFIPVYLRADSDGDSVEYHVYECDPVSVESDMPVLADIGVRNYTAWQIQL